METNFASKRQDNLNRFYTRTAVGELVADQLGDFVPRNVLDLGAGQGTLSSSVVRRWKGTDAVTVDIDPHIITRLNASLLEAGAHSHRHHIHDVLDVQLPEALAEYGEFDLAVCNPPFFRPTWNRDFAEILDASNFADACPSTADVTAEILFLAQNLRMVRDGGKIALIAPDSLLTGWRMKAFRRALMEYHKVDCVLQLPNHSFHDTEARCFILVVSKNTGPTGKVQLLRFDAAAGLSDPIMIDRFDAEHRMDYDFHCSRSAFGGRVATLRELGAEIKRGSLGSVESRAADYSTFHTTDYRCIEHGMIALNDDSGMPPNRKLIVAETGDILMARVDRSLHLKVAMVVSGRAAVTDCVYRVRISPDVRNAVFNALRSPSGTAHLLSITKGVSARLLGKSDLLDLPLQLSS